MLLYSTRFKRALVFLIHLVLSVMKVYGFAGNTPSLNGCAVFTWHRGYLAPFHCTLDWRRIKEPACHILFWRQPAPPRHWDPPMRAFGLEFGGCLFSGPFSPGLTWTTDSPLTPFTMATDFSHLPAPAPRPDHPFEARIYHFFFSSITEIRSSH